MAEDRPEVTWSVTELHEAVKGLLGHAFGTRVWVTTPFSNSLRGQTPVFTASLPISTDSFGS